MEKTWFKNPQPYLKVWEQLHTCFPTRNGLELPTGWRAEMLLQEQGQPVAPNPPSSGQRAKGVFLQVGASVLNGPGAQNLGEGWEFCLATRSHLPPPLTFRDSFRNNKPQQLKSPLSERQETQAGESQLKDELHSGMTKWQRKPAPLRAENKTKWADSQWTRAKRGSTRGL